MDEEWEDIMLKRKYNELARKLSQINRELETVNDINFDLEEMANDTLRINNKTVEDKTFNELNYETQKIMTKIDNTIAQCEKM